MALAGLRRKTEATEGAGNCAFNAFTLGLCNAKILSQLEQTVRATHTTPDLRFKRFIRHAAVALQVEPKWTNVKDELLRLQQVDRRRLQHLVAPVLRELSVDLAVKPADASLHYKQTEIYLKSAFRDYYRRYRGKPATFSDDVYGRHAFIQEEFERVSRLNISKIEKIDAMMVWWRDCGHLRFLQTMRQNDQWAGDLELVRLARYFGLVLDILSDGYTEPYTAYGNNGRFPYLHGDLGKNISERDQLVIMSGLHERGILKGGFEYMDDQGIEFSLPDLPLIYRRIDAVPHSDLVEAFISEHCQDLKWQPVPVTWPRTTIVELLYRTVIVGTREPGRYQFAMDAELAVLYTNAIPCSDQIKAICKMYFEVRPRMLLCNHGGVHWENTVPLPDPFFEEMIQRSGLFALGGLPNMFGNAAYASILSRSKSEEDVIKRFT